MTGCTGPAVDNDFATNKWVYLYYALVNMDPPYPASTPAGNAPTTPQADPSVWDVWKGYSSSPAGPRRLPGLPRHGPARRDLLGTGALLTGLAPSGHGIVGNRWYFRELGEPLLWRQSNALVGGEKVWETARRAMPGYRAANLCWWYAIGASTDITLTPKPIYHADGRKSPDCYTVPAGLQAVRPRPRAGG